MATTITSTNKFNTLMKVLYLRVSFGEISNNQFFSLDKDNEDETEYFDESDIYSEVEKTSQA